MISHFLDVPLRYPLEHKGSRSQITDLVMDKLTDKEREYEHSQLYCFLFIMMPCVCSFPLYSKGQDKFQFSYGVFLLNKDIAQVGFDF
jgi:hypothetical protein